MKVVIIGNGIAGITAARHIRKLSDHSINVISSESKYFFARTALMYEYMGQIREKDLYPYETWFWGKNRIGLIHDHVSRIDFHNKRVETATGSLHHYDKLIIACGSSSNMPDIPGIDADGVRALYSLQDLDYLKTSTKSISHAVVIGGGLIGIELVEMLLSRNISVSLLVREPSFWSEFLPHEEAEIIHRHILSYNVDLKLNTVVKNIITESGKAAGVVTASGENIPCGFVGICTGVHPNVKWLSGCGLEINDGILVDEFLQTNIKDVYAIGDCAELRTSKPERRRIEPLWYAGRIMGETVAHTICSAAVKYDPGIWFNSAKFLDIEYQVYGNIKPDHPYSFFWQHESGTKCLRIDYAEESEVIGIHSLGVRLRQEVCEKWIMENYRLNDVIRQIGLALFDAELSEDFSKSIQEQFNGPALPDQIRRSNYNPVHGFLRQSASQIL